MDKEREIFKKAEKKFYNDVSLLVSMINELILKNKQNTTAKNDRIQFTIIKSLKYFCIKKSDANVYKRVTYKLKRDLKEFNINISINIDSILTDENKNILDEAWCKYMKTIEPIVLETYKKMRTPLQQTLIPYQDSGDLNTNKIISIYEALPNYDYTKSELKTYASHWNRCKYIDIEEAVDPNEIDKKISIEDPEKAETDIDINLSIQEILENNYDEREQLMVKKRFYLDRTFEEIARQFEITGPRVHKIINDILITLKNELNE